MISSMKRSKCALGGYAGFFVQQASGAGKPKELMWVVVGRRQGGIATELGRVIGNRLLKIGSFVCPKVCCNVSNSLEV